MAKTGLEIIEHAAQGAREWVHELDARLDWGDPGNALRLLRATLSALRDRLGPEEAAQLSAQLPLLIRGMFYEGWDPTGKPVTDRAGDGFLAEIERHVGAVSEYRGSADVTTVLRMLESHVSEGEARDVKARLPQGIRALWPD